LHDSKRDSARTNTLRGYCAARRDPDARQHIEPKPRSATQKAAAPKTGAAQGVKRYVSEIYWTRTGAEYVPQFVLDPPTPY
jgi:hypothetical protein